MGMSHAAIVPLIGGMTLGAARALGTAPEYILSYTPFAKNDEHSVRYLGVPYHVLDRGERHPRRVDMVTALCPCAGLSALSPAASSDNLNNRWMFETAEYVLGQMRPQVFLGENAPQLTGRIGQPVMKRLQRIARDNGYTMSAIMTNSLLHGIGQTRNRSFYMFWAGDRYPSVGKMRREHTDIEDVITSVLRRDTDPMWTPVNPKVPSQDPFYRYVLEDIERCTHAEFQARIPKTTSVMDHVEKHRGYEAFSTWLTERQFHRVAERVLKLDAKIKSGGNIMRKHIEVPKGKINAFVGHMPGSLTHPYEDRFLTIRECLSIMRMPDDFELGGGKKSINHVCQNVPLTTAADVVTEVLQCLDDRREWNHATEDVPVFDNRKEGRDPMVASKVFV